MPTEPHSDLIAGANQRREVDALFVNAPLRDYAERPNGSGPEPRLGLFFQTGRWIGEPANHEPQKCSAVCWFPLHALPDRLIDYPARGIHAYREGAAFSIHGWNADSYTRTNA